MFEKLVLEDVRSSLEARGESLMKMNEGLMMPNEILEYDLADRDRELEVLKANHDRLLQVGLVCVMDKLIEHPECARGISNIRHLVFFASEESVRAGLKAQVDDGTYDPFASDSCSSYS
uniref:Uncharacterized protein n=1 Tax=Lactuca sativa TaxID=4236 RepID=A0A9R1XVT9_LACSA|nr:hypothetical protein LSAT_V11C200094980 [Lactuca sativa]